MVFFDHESGSWAFSDGAQANGFATEEAATQAFEARKSWAGARTVRERDALKNAAGFKTPNRGGNAPPIAAEAPTLDVQALIEAAVKKALAAVGVGAPSVGAGAPRPKRSRKAAE